MLYKLKLSSCQTNHLHVFLGGVQKIKGNVYDFMENLYDHGLPMLGN